MTTISGGLIRTSGTAEPHDDGTGLILPVLPGYGVAASALAADLADFTLVSGNASGINFGKPAFLLNIGGINGSGGAANYYGSGGNGGDGIKLDAGGIVVNTGKIGGGDGGASGLSPLAFPISYRYGGAGGTGIIGSRGLVINLGTISGGDGGNANSQSSPIPSIAGPGGDGISLGPGGGLVNFGLISGGGAGAPEFLDGFSNGNAAGIGAAFHGGKTPDMNFGDIVGGSAGYGGSPGIGVALATVGTFINFGTVSAGSGVYNPSFPGQFVGMELAGGSTLYNAGRIGSGYGGSGYAVLFTGGDSRLVIDADAKFSSTVSAFGGNNVIELTGGEFGRLSGLGSSFTGFQTLAVDAHAAWAVSGSIATVANIGTLEVANGTSLDITGAVAPDSTGIFALAGKSSLEIAQLLGSDTKIAFLGGSQTLIVDQPAKFGLNAGGPHYAGPLLEDFTAGDEIELKGVGYKGLGTQYNSATGLLQVTLSGGGVVASLDFQNASLGAGHFHLTSDNAGGVFLTLT